jgi:beta-lactamase class A
MPKALAIALAGLLAMPGAAIAQETAHAPTAEAQTALEMRSQQVVSLLNDETEPEAIFTQAFRNAVPDAQLKALSASLAAQVGRAVAVELLTPHHGTRAALEIRFERGIAKGAIAVDPAEANRVSELLFRQIEPLAVANDTPDKIATDLARLPGIVNAGFGPLGGAPVISIGADKPLALGSTFKLYVLAALAEDVKAGRRKWNDVVPLTEQSYPSGQLQNWPKGAPLTLYTLAGLMISISDNTATDQLIKLLGRQRILKLIKDSGHSNLRANDPFLTTRELFILKTVDPVFLDAWRTRSPDAMTAAEVLMEVANPTLDEVNAAFAKGPKAIDIEWFASPADLAKLFAHMRRTADPKAFDILAINPSATPGIKANWAYIGFKGGSEPGVLNLTWLLTDKAGKDHVLTLGWNNPAAALDQGKMEAIAQRILLLPR